MGIRGRSLLARYRHRRGQRQFSAKSSDVTQANGQSCLDDTIARVARLERRVRGRAVVETNPCRERKRLHEPERSGYVSSEEQLAVYDLAPKVMQPCSTAIMQIHGLGSDHRSREATYCDYRVVTSNSKPKKASLLPSKSMRRHPRHG
jgi:hypothetical protein